MNTLCSSVLIMLMCFIARAEKQIYVASTPANGVVRDFLKISAADSIDFIRWKIELDGREFKLECEYGLSQPSTPGFSNGQQVAFQGELTKKGAYYELKHKGKSISLFEMNSNVLHFVDENGQMLIGNGGYSYALNNKNPSDDNKINIRPVNASLQNPQVFEGRTPCQELSDLLGLNKSEACNKMKWYILLYTDPETGKPAHFLMGGMGYRKESMARGEWKIVAGPDNRLIYELSFKNWARPLQLLKADDDILFFTDSTGRLLAGNEHFSYTLNRRSEEVSAVKR